MGCGGGLECWVGMGSVRVEMLTYNRGQYSDAVLNELESQNDQQVEGILGKVRLLKDVSLDFLSLLPLRLSCEEHWADLWCNR
jgi:hypothetical protein